MAVQQKLNLPFASKEKAEELATLLFQVEYFIAHLEPKDNREAVAVEVLQIVCKLQDFRQECASMTEAAHDLFFKLFYFFSHLDPSQFEKMAVDGLDILKDVHDTDLLVMEPEAEAALVVAPVLAPAPVKEDEPVIAVVAEPEKQELENPPPADTAPVVLAASGGSQ